jgi:hypothetical protein
MKLTAILLAAGFLATALLGSAAVLGAAPVPAAGYPKPVSFRAATPELLPEMGNVQMLVSDILPDVRRGVEAEFKKLHPDRTVLVQHDADPLVAAWFFTPQQVLEDWGLYPVTQEAAARGRRLQGFADGLHPITDFLGYWLYDAGSDSLNAIPAKQRAVTIRVKDVEPFRPNTLGRAIKDLQKEVGLEAYHKNVVICPRDAAGALDWLQAELATITALDQETKTITVERLGREGSWHAFAPGAYVAPDSSLMFTFNVVSRYGLTPRSAAAIVLRRPHPNLTRFCPRDPRTGLNAAEFFAKDYVRLKQQHYPSADGLVFDVSIGMFYSSRRVSAQVDCDLDGKPDNFFINKVNHWALGMYDCLHAIRAGVPGKFSGLGEGIQFVADVNANDDQRFFDLMNGAEFEHAMQHPVLPAGQHFSSSLDTFLLWAERGRKPDVGFVHNKYPDEAYHGGDAALLKPPMTLAWYRLNMAAACMGNGYVGKNIGRTAYGAPEALCDFPGRMEQRRKFGGFAPPPDYDEYHAGDRNVRGWLGQPTSAPARLTSHLGAPVWRFDGASPLPAIESTDSEYRAAGPVRVADDALRLTVESAGLWRSDRDFFKLKTVFPLAGVMLKAEGEYSLRLTGGGDGPFAKMEPRYRGIPRNIAARLVVTGPNGKPVPSPYQEFLIFKDPRSVNVTLTAPANGEASLEFCIGEGSGTVELRGIELRPGCADVLWRAFEHGVVLLNGSVGSPVEFPMESLFPGQRYRRLQGRQDPAHNNGQPVGARATLAPLDGLFLLREQVNQ